MRLLATILSFLIINLSVNITTIGCQHHHNERACYIDVKEETSLCCKTHSDTKKHLQNQNQQNNESNNHCSHLCFCGCCTTHTILTNNNLTEHYSVFKIVKEKIYSNQYSFQYFSSIWHPPTLS